MQQKNVSATAYDDAYRTMLEKCSSLILPVLSELFGEAFSGDEEIILTQNVEIRTPDGRSISFSVPVMKLRSYSLDELFDKKLWFLLPFHSFCYEKSLRESEKNGEWRTVLSDVFREMRSRIDDLCNSGQMNECQKYRIIFCARMVAEKLMEKYPNVRKEVLDAMGGKVVECEVDRILQRGMEQGEQKMIEKMLRNHKTPEEIADFCNCELQEVKTVQQKMLIEV